MKHSLIKEKHNRKQVNTIEFDDEIKDLNFDFVKERNFIANKYGYKPWEIEFDMFHPCGEICIFVKNVWMGYVDDSMTEEMKKFYSNKT